MTIKANQPSLLTAAQHALAGPAAGFAEHTKRNRGHGRTEERILRTTPLTTAMPIEFPPAAQLFRVIRYPGDLTGQRHTKEVAHCLTSLTPDKATPQDLSQLLREHWAANREQTPLGPRLPSAKTPPPCAPAPPHRP